MRRFAACLVVILGIAIAVQPIIAAGPTAPQQGKPDDPGNSGSAPGQDKDKGKGDPGTSKPEGTSKPTGKVQISWDLTKAEIAAALLATGAVAVNLQTSGLVENVGLWLTPSLAKYLTVEADLPDALEPETDYPVVLSLTGERPAKTIGGTLHLVSILESSDGLRRTYPKPLAINVKFGAAAEQDETEGGQTIAVVSSASYTGPAIAPLQIVSIFGLGIGPEVFQGLIIKDGKITDYLADVQVFFDGTAAPIIFASSEQLNVVVPSDVAGKSEVTLVVTFLGDSWEVTGIPVADAIPEIFAMNGLGHGLAAALDADGQLISEDNPAAPGDWITLFGTGVGLWKDGFIDGTVVDAANLPVAKKPVEITVGGAPAKVLYIGGAPGMVSGVVQFNVVVPELSAMELEDGKAQIVLTSAGHPSKADIFIYIGAAPAAQ